MRRLNALFAAASWLALVGGPAPPAAAAPFSGLAVRNAQNFAGMVEVWRNPLLFERRTNGPSEQGFKTGSKTWQDATTFGQFNQCGHGGQQAEWFTFPPLCNPGGGYPANGQVSQPQPGVTRITLEPTPASISGQVPHTYNGTNAWAYVSAQISTKQSVNWIPDKGWCWAIMMRMPSVAGTWPAFWFQNINDTPAVAAAQAEVDQPEHLQGVGPTSLSANFHWATVQGGTYFSSNGETNNPTKVEDNDHLYTSCADSSGNLTFAVDGVQIQHFLIPSNAVGYWGQRQFMILLLTAGNTATFPGVYAGGTSVLDVEPGYPRLYMRSDAAAGGDYFLNTVGDGKGPETIFAANDGTLGVTSGANGCQAPGFCQNNGSTSAAGTSVDSLPAPVVVASANQTWHRFEFYGTAPISQVTAGHTYTVLVKYKDNGASDSGAGYETLGVAGATTVDFTFTGTTVTPGTSSCASQAIAAVGSHKEQTCQWTPATSGAVYFGIGPNSTTVGKTIQVFSVSVRDNVPTT